MGVINPTEVWSPPPLLCACWQKKLSRGFRKIRGGPPPCGAPFQGRLCGATPLSPEPPVSREGGVYKKFARVFFPPWGHTSPGGTPGSSLQRAVLNMRKISPGFHMAPLGAPGNVSGLNQVGSPLVWGLPALPHSASAC